MSSSGGKVATTLAGVQWPDSVLAMKQKPDDWRSVLAEAGKQALVVHDPDVPGVSSGYVYVYREEPRALHIRCTDFHTYLRFDHVQVGVGDAERLSNVLSNS